ncbi:MAG: outer membrane lipoprotein carrier protein LolA [Bdellovibrionales bacterium]|nr:outer membrane lipoprotein carrier protein LolA [Bdellovibrionales bacterium]
MNQLVSLFIFVFITFNLTPVFASSNTGLELIKKTMSRYQLAPAVEITLSKIVTLALLDETKKSEGRLFFSKGKMRLEIDKPEESIIVMNNNTLWVETPTPEELGGKTQVIKIRSQELSQQAKAPLAALLGKPSAWDQMKLLKEENKSGVVSLILAPKKENTFGDVVSISLEINRDSNEISKIGYKDDLDNETKFEFQKSNFKAKATKNMFQYVPPKNSQITEY